jgi:hypothetical protein
MVTEFKRKIKQWSTMRKIVAGAISSLTVILLSTLIIWTANGVGWIVNGTALAYTNADKIMAEREYTINEIKIIKDKLDTNTALLIKINNDNEWIVKMLERKNSYNRKSVAE